jgi:3-hydroxyacyl-CoA dehydrogenase
MTKEKYEKTLSLLTGVLDYEKFKSVDLVIEASSVSINHTSATSSDKL